MKYLTINQTYWNTNTQKFINSHPELMNENMFPSWGIWYKKEADLHILDDLQKNSKILDIGCGIGNNLVGWARLGMDCYGIDLSQQMINSAIAHSQCHYVCSPVERMPYPDCFFDAAYCNHGAFDFSPPEAALQEVNRVLKNGAFLAICTYSELAQLCFSRTDGSMKSQLVNNYKNVRLEKSTGSPLIVSLSHSAWIDTFESTGFQVKKLIELQAQEQDKQYFLDSPNLSWSLRWPAEDIWKIQKVSNVIK